MPFGTHAKANNLPGHIVTWIKPEQALQYAPEELGLAHKSNMQEISSGFEHVNLKKFSAFALFAIVLG